MQDTIDVEGVGFLREADTVVPRAEAEFFRFPLEPLDVTLAGLGQTVQGGKNVQGGVAIQPADVGAGWRGEEDSLHLDWVETLRSLMAINVRFGEGESCGKAAFSTAPYGR